VDVDGDVHNYAEDNRVVEAEHEGVEMTNEANGCQARRYDPASYYVSTVRIARLCFCVLQAILDGAGENK
jgi:hypothetical protein